MTKYAVEIEPGVWLAAVSGDPGLTLRIENATTFHSRAKAEMALRKTLDKHPGKFRYAVTIEIMPLELPNG